mmetsp:Transcript_6390/g.9086  ORF Transcript_6390/g.9086 Transcript_6390/m.9086 type:complete len:94 (-) Transcript_6390:118-399(-)
MVSFELAVSTAAAAGFASLEDVSSTIHHHHHHHVSSKMQARREKQDKTRQDMLGRRQAGRQAGLAWQGAKERFAKGCAAATVTTGVKLVRQLG